MRILMVHNKYLIRGGEDESTDTEIAALRNAGHHVEEYIVDNIELAKKSKLRIGLTAIWSWKAYKEVRMRLQNAEYDIVHVQNFFPILSPSVHYAAKRERVSTVQTLRNFRLICVNGQFFRNGRVCQKCVGRVIPWPGVMLGCYRQSKLQSLAVAGMLVFHRLRKTWRQQVDGFIVATPKVKAIMVDEGLQSKKIFVKPNIVRPDPGSGESKGRYAIYVGRISPEKGVETLLRAWSLAGVPKSLVIVGDGPLRENLMNRYRNLPNILWIGRKPLAEVYDQIRNADYLFFPSEWFESFGRTVVEAFACGTPVIVSNQTVASEFVREGETGYLFKSGDVCSLVSAINRIEEKLSSQNNMRSEARKAFVAQFSEGTNVETLLDIYDKVMSSRTDTL